MKADQRPDSELIVALRGAGQGHVLRWWDELDSAGRAQLMEQLRWVELDPLRALIADVRAGRINPAPAGRPELPDYVRLPATPEEKSAREKTRAAGERLFSAGKVAVVMVAGGQGTRLGFDAPKGTFPIGPVSARSLFQIHAERILATRRRCGGPLPWYIMTSDATDRPTKDYFEKRAWFGLPREDVRFFRQRMMPALDRHFRLVLVAKDRILLSPNGHGGTLPALAESGMLDDMERRGIEEISYFQVDNGLAPAADPVFLGGHSLAGAEMSSKALWKREPEEPIGAFVRVGDAAAPSRAPAPRLVVREYSDLTREQMHQRTAGGQLLYGLGSIGIHVLRVDFVRRETQPGFNLPFHLAEKSSPFLDESGALVQPKGKNIYKFETFIFDALRDTHRTVVLEVRREEEFSPLKNAAGKDSPETCRRDMSALYANWLEQAGVRVPRDERGAPKHPIEISPLFALDADELAGKIPRDLNLAGPLLLAPPKRGAPA
jgi:UDP-N-acetylglucosamine/UDP-N-acetylgalactosamine diphosphorylase